MLTALIAVAATVGLLAAILLWTALKLQTARKETSASGDLVVELTQALNLLNGNRADYERQVRSEVAVELTQAQAAARDALRRAGEYQGVIEGVLNERNSWNRLYDEQTIAHGNAQAIMMDAIGFLERKLREAGVNVELPPVVRETQALYLDRHVNPVLQRTEAAKAQPPPSQGQTMSAQGRLDAPAGQEGSL